MKKKSFKSQGQTKLYDKQMAMFITLISPGI